MGLRLGLDVGGSKTRAVVWGRTEAGPEILADHRLPTRTGHGGVVDSILRASDQALDQLGLGRDALEAVGVGLPGLVDPGLGLVRQAANLGLVELDLAQALRRGFDCPIRVENDVKASAWGAAQLLQRCDNLTYVNVGTGLALATVLDGRLLRGQDNVAGEIGHLTVSPGGPRCACGQRGCLETVVGGGPLSRRLADLGLDLAGLLGDPRPVARQQASRLVAGLATAVRVAALAYDPALIVLGGGVVSTAVGLTELVRHHLASSERSSPLLAQLRPSQRLVELAADQPVGALGAAELAADAAQDRFT
ncbi:MAG: ROK family protein [Propionibacteriaceae bacterium]|nr:ROK family protein [Propionibacteriaceae bacterium]